MNWKKLGLKLAAAGLPAIGAGLAGSAGAGLGSRIAQILDVEAEPDAIARAMATDPDLALALRQIEVEEAAAIRAGEQLALETTIADVQHARETARPVDDWIRSILAIILPLVAVVFAGAFIGALIWKDQITEAVGIAGMVLGWLIRDASSSTGFYFGTSLGSAKKSKELAVVAAQERR